MGLTVALLLAENPQRCSSVHPSPSCYCLLLLLLLFSGQQAENAKKTRVKPENTWLLGFSRYFRVLPALDAGDRRGSLPGLPYCCSAGLTLATVVGEPHCCSVVTVNTSNTVQLLTFDNPTRAHTPRGPRTCRRATPAPGCLAAASGDGTDRYHRSSHRSSHKRTTKDASLPPHYDRRKVSN